MALSLALIILFALLFGRFFDQLKLPALLGMLLIGILLGPYGFDLISQDILNISSDLRMIALIVILIRAGLGIEKETLKKVGIPAVKLSFIPGLMEGSAVILAAIYLLNFGFVEAGILAFIIAAVSPAVVVPQMLALIDQQKGAKKGVPTLILTGASVDDVVAITIFSAFLSIYGGQQINVLRQILNVPIAILLGIIFGTGVALFSIYIFKKYHIRDTKKALLLLSFGIIMNSLEHFLEGIVPVATLLGIMVIGFVIQDRYSALGKRLSSKFNKIWVFAELMLFVLIGAEVNIQLAFESGLIGLIIIAIGLSARSIGVIISLAGTHLNLKEKCFCVLAYTPKATVQAAIGAIPLAAGVASGELILALAVLSIVVTAPLGAIAIKTAGEHWLSDDSASSG
ncbi:sodium/proton antiporter (CPA1 family) [Halanaerobium saccharolyticum]|uniref:Sodium/proton antiporter (CPA1 family) n=1 Tax=Halanaerobium saccharolyticum TaxID=43595 RepID=A0A4R7Z9T4_9FIRM|nr:cation:proton antiporter [Halanaerobium saccharolyticum]RAK10544.1 sodium/proton antiporter (CPA1 family) [Halanaerobium saccharolyticum]TDW06699.1 sodium/proton antiporter (CPA1 family) [Halanaerobium saccharolyticum]TDX62334.1 sodium/proton antiporter (CPA1 family) [Halanaerobium saccharolyticum]